MENEDIIKGLGGGQAIANIAKWLRNPDKINKEKAIR